MILDIMILTTNTSMLILYTKDNCPYCEKVKKVFSDRRIAYEERNIKYPEFLQEVQAHNARTMPFMVDPLAHVTMGESDDIIDYASEYSF